MQLHPVKSGSITHIGYDAERLELRVQFTNGGVYRYSGVTPQQKDAFISAESIGKHFQQHIRGKFQTEKVS